MAIDPALTPIGSGFNRNLINTNFERIDDALQDALSRSGTSPNMMEADLDLNGNDLLNAGSIDTERLIVDGTEYVFNDAIAKGDPGDTPVITFLPAITGAPGTNVIATQGGTVLAPTVQLTIPRGDTGASGAGTGDMLASLNLSDLVSKPTAFANIKQDASTTATGVLEIATDAEAIAGVDTTRAIVPSSLAATLAGASGMVLLSSGNVGSTLTLDLSTYTSYFSFRLECSNLSATTNSQLSLRLGAGGIDSGGSDYIYNRLDGYSSNSSFDTVNNTGNNRIGLSADNAFRSGADGDLEVQITNPSVAKRCNVRTNYNGLYFGTSMTFSQTWGQRSSSKAIDRIQLLCSAGTLASGTYRLYGYK